MALPFDPFLTQMLICTVCDTFFQQAHTDGDEIICPHPQCGAAEADFWVVLEEEIDEAFWELMGCAFTEARRMNLRCIAEAEMEAFNPLTRLL